MDTSKIIRGIVNGRNYTVTSPIVKEDYGLVLQIEGVELPPTYQVDFSNSESNGTSVTMIGNSDGVLIPRQFIDSGKDVFAFLYHVGEDFGRTVYKFRIPNKVRPDRTNEEPTPEEQSVIDQAISALNEAVEQTSADVASADQSAQNASQDADRAEDARDNAQTYANNASASATSASQSATASANSATASAQSASQSAQIKSDVEDLADDAQGYAQASAQSASASANSASQAQGFAQSASSSAQSASQYASQAQGYANTASAKAQDASGYAQTASQKATESAQSATDAQGYAQTAETAKMDAQTAQGLAESARDSAVQAKTDAESAKADAESARDEAQQAVASISGALADKAPIITDTASGSIASFSDGADNLPLKSLVIDIDPVQDLHGQDSPYPAGGGKNKFPTPTADSKTQNGLTCVSDGYGKLSFNGATSGGGFNQTFNLAGSYTIQSGDYLHLLNDTASGNISIILINENEETIASPSIYLVNRIFDLASYVGKTVASVRIYATDNTEFNGAMTPMIVASSSATAWSPYENICPISGWTSVGVNHSDADMTNPTTLTINLGQTVYGGKLDVLSGVLTVDMANIASYNGETLPSTWISDRDVYASGTTPTTGAQVVYQLATPLEIQFDAHAINSLLGVNNIWADSGDTEVEYRADTKLFIERLTAPDSADMVADANITSGQYFMVGNSLYKATANIANGGQIIVGTNATRVSLAQALNEINA